jgi:hypothetical protein
MINWKESALVSAAMGALMFLLVTGCAPAAQYDDPLLQQLVEEVREARRPTLYVKNSGMDPISIYGTDGFKLGSINPGQSKCIDMQQYMHEDTPVIIRQTGRFYRTESVIWGSAPGWYLEIGTAIHLDVNTMMPSSNRYKRCRR